MRDAAHRPTVEANQPFVAEEAVVSVGDADDVPAMTLGASTTARMTAFRPGASPPPVFTAMRRILVMRRS